MSASEKISVDESMPFIKKIAIIAGGGAIPSAVASSLRTQGIEPFIVAFNGQTNLELTKGYAHMWAPLGAAGKVMQRLRDENISDIIIVGSMRRPSLSELRPDRKTLEFFTKYALKAGGDDSFLKKLRAFLEHEGFTLHGAHKFMPELLAPLGLMTSQRPAQSDQNDIDRGIEILKALSNFDIGQAVLIQNGMVLGVEAAEGTAKLIERCADLRRGGAGGVLIKAAKDGQDPDLDLPTIGPETIKSLKRAGFSGVAVQAASTMIVEYEEVCKTADQLGIFVFGFKSS